MAAARRIQLLQMKYHTACRSMDILDGLARNTELSPEQESDFIVRFQDLEKVYEAFTEMFYELQLSAADIESFDLESHTREYESYNKKYYFIKQRHLGLTKSNTSANLDNSCSSGSGNDNPKNARNRAVLPKVKLPTFAGQVEEFVPFMELFQSLVGNDTTLSDTEKMYYLAGSLLGEPKSLIQHLSVTGDNFSVAIDLLNARYNNKRLLADRLLHNLLSVPHVDTKGVSGLKMFLNTLIENTKALEKMKFPVDSWCYLLFYINFQKLDNNLRKHFEDKHADKELPAFSDLLKFLETEIRILECSADPEAVTSSAANRRSGNSQSHAVTAHAAFHQNKGSTASCRLCGNSGHSIARCDKFLEMKPWARKRQVVSLRLCFKCLNGHNIDQCTYNKNCYKCNSAKHHTLLHFDPPETGSDSEERLTSKNVPTSGRTYNPISLSPSAPIANEPLISDNPGGAVPGVTGTGLTASHVNKPIVYQRRVLLATAIIRVRDSSGCYQEARALLDGGSESTFISESCVQRLGLKRFKSDNFTGLSGLPVSGCRGAVNLAMAPRLSDTPVLIARATVLNRITNNIPGISLPAQLADNYRGLYLADDQFYVSRGIDILIGEDLLNDILLSGRLTINEHIPRITKTVFGHVLSGPVTIAALPQATCFAQTFICTRSSDETSNRFIEAEDVPDKVDGPKDLECKTFLKDTHQRYGGVSYFADCLSRFLECGKTVLIAMKRFLAVLILFVLLVVGGNRVSQIVNCGADIVWRHLPSYLNPVDVVSSGFRASELIQPLLWESVWLTGDADTWPKNIMDKAEDPLPELREVDVNVQAVVRVAVYYNIYTRIFILSMLLAVVAYYFWYVNITRTSSERYIEVLTVSKRRFALQRLFKLVQQMEFADIFKCLDLKKYYTARLRRFRPILGMMAYCTLQAVWSIQIL